MFSLVGCCLFSNGFFKGTFIQTKDGERFKSWKQTIEQGILGKYIQNNGATTIAFCVYAELFAGTYLSFTFADDNRSNPETAEISHHSIFVYIPSNMNCLCVSCFLLQGHHMQGGKYVAHKLCFVGQGAV